MVATLRGGAAASAAPDSWLGRTREDLLRALDGCLRAAERLLDVVAGGSAVHTVEKLLTEADDLCATLVLHPDLDGQAAHRMSGIRDDLSSYLAAAVDLESVGIPSTAILKRGLHDAVSEIAEIQHTGE